MTNHQEKKLPPAWAKALRRNIRTGMTSDKRLESPGFVPNCPESSGFVQKRRESPGIVQNGPEMSRNAKVRHGGTHDFDEISNIYKGLPVSLAVHVRPARTRRKYGDWQQAAELFALGRTPVEVADCLGVPLSKVMRNLRESRRLRRWIAEHHARHRPRRAEWPPPNRALRSMRLGQRIRTKMPSPPDRLDRSPAKVPGD